MYEQDVIQLIKSETAFLGSYDGSRPRVRPMKPYIDSDGRIWLFSRFDTRKVAELEQYPRVELCVLGKAGEILTVVGRVKDETRPGSSTYKALKDMMFGELPEMRKQFPDNDATALVIYRMVVHEVRYVKADYELVTRVNLPMEQDPDIDLAMCQGGFCLLEE
jgi:uncharacterized pyridoxamine 5'-phosphate oxidase family protein